MNQSRCCVVIQEWANVTKQQIMAKFDRNNEGVSIYTMHPGILIGVSGKLFYEMRDKLAELGCKKVDLVECDEIFTPGNDWNDILEERFRGFCEMEDVDEFL